MKGYGRIASGSAIVHDDNFQHTTYANKEYIFISSIYHCLSYRVHLQFPCPWLDLREAKRREGRKSGGREDFICRNTIAMNKMQYKDTWGRGREEEKKMNEMEEVGDTCSMFVLL